MPRAVLLGGLDEPLDLPVGEIFTAALANCYIYEVGAASRSREFSMETALPPICTVTDLAGTCNRSGWMFKPSAARYCRGLGGEVVKGE